MSIPRSAIAYTLDIPEERVRCENCVCADDTWTDGLSVCRALGGDTVSDDAYCPLFADREDHT